MIRIIRQAVLAQLAQHRPHPNVPLRILLDLTTLPKTGKFRQLSTATEEENVYDRMALT